MDFSYTINDISSKVNVSKQSLYTLIKKNQAFINENSTRKQRKIYYNQAAMDFFISYYSTDTDTDKKIPDKIIKSDGAEEQAENSLLETSYKEEAQEARINALQDEIQALHAQIDLLQKQLDAKEEERKELIRQNGALILTLQQEKQEKQLFLPAPKRSITDRVKGLFHK